MKKNKKNYLMKDVFFHGIQVKPPVDPDVHINETPNIPVALYVKCKHPGSIKYEVFVNTINISNQGLDVIATYGDYEGAEGTSFRSALKNMLNDLYNNPEWDAVIIDSEDNFPPGTQEYNALCLIKDKVPVFTLEYVKNFKY